MAEQLHSLGDVCGDVWLDDSVFSDDGVQVKTICVPEIVSFDSYQCAYHYPLIPKAQCSLSKPSQKNIVIFSSIRTRQQSQRAETSLSITMISSIIPFVNNTILTVF